MPHIHIYGSRYLRTNKMISDVKKCLEAWFVYSLRQYSQTEKKRWGTGCVIPDLIYECWKERAKKGKYFTRKCDRTIKQCLKRATTYFFQQHRFFCCRCIVLRTSMYVCTYTSYHTYLPGTRYAATKGAGMSATVVVPVCCVYTQSCAILVIIVSSCHEILNWVWLWYGTSFFSTGAWVGKWVLLTSRHLVLLACHCVCPWTPTTTIPCRDDSCKAKPLNYSTPSRFPAGRLTGVSCVTCMCIPLLLRGRKAGDSMSLPTRTSFLSRCSNRIVISSFRNLEP